MGLARAWSGSMTPLGSVPEMGRIKGGKTVPARGDGPVIVLETERLLLRRLLPGDLDDRAALYGDPDIRRHFPEGTLTVAETKEELTWFLDGHPEDGRLDLWATIHKESRRFIGRCGLLPWIIDGVPEVEIAYLLAKSHWRRGLGAEVARALVRHGFDRLSLTRLIALIDPENGASIRTAERGGLAFEREVDVDGVRASLYAIAAMASE